MNIRLPEITPVRIRLTLQSILLIGLILALFRGQWLNALAVTGIMVVTLLPTVLGQRFHVYIPPEFEALAIIFIFASLFLGEYHGYYIRFWWWDALLHTVSGFMLGLLGFLLVHVLNEQEDLELHMKPGFVALFAFMFAIGMGTLWEIFEFSMDGLFGLNMQKSGLLDTMGDLIVDTIGALTIALLGYSYLKTTGNRSFLEQWIQRFIDANPQLFRRS